MRPFVTSHSDDSRRTGCFRTLKQAEEEKDGVFLISEELITVFSHDCTNH